MRRFCQQKTTQMVFSIIGACFLIAPSVIHFIWGNLSIYVLSYIHQHSPSVSEAEASWTSSLYLLAQSITLFPAGHMIPRLGRKTMAIIGVVLFNSGVFASYFAIESSLIAVILSIGALSGVGSGLLYATSTDYGVQWSSEKNTGLITVIIFNSYNAMAVIVNEFITFYINPLNELPLLSSGDNAFFSQRDILLRVPRLFLILGVMFLALQIVGILLLKDNPTDWPLHKEDVETTELTRSIRDSSKKDKAVVNLSPKGVLRTASFHFIWAGFFASEFSFLMVTINYKAFGLLWIDDDYFLTTMGTAFVVVMVITKTIGGVAADKMGPRVVLIFIYSGIVVCSSFLYVSPQINRWLYYFLVVSLVSLSGTSFLVNTVAVIRLFGRQHAVVNISLLNMATTLMMLVAPPTMQLLMSQSGWSSVFLSGAAFSFVGLLLVVVGVRDN